ncbi:ATP-binding protein [Methylococcus sp. ANG]|uniref:sensor histidine kinase n=1 Tax=Methylococcus sp. ANG TaxID=3231903 RepID=UPI00345A9C96
MVIRKLRIRLPLSLVVIALFTAIVASLHLMSSATQSSPQLGSMYSLLVLINSVGSILLLTLVVVNVYGLLRQLAKRAAGSHLTARMAFLFVLLSLAPASIVFYYSMQFLKQSIDSWFDVRIDQAMEDALELGQAALDERMRTMLHQTEQAAAKLQLVPIMEYPLRLTELRDEVGEGEFTVFSRQGRIIAAGGSQLGFILPDLPDAGVLLRVKQGKSYIRLEPNQDGNLQIRAVVAIPSDDPLFLQAVFPVPLRISQLASTVESAYVHYKELGFLRSSLKHTFILTLSLVLLLSLLAAIWVAFVSIRRIVAPVRRLAQGTRAVAEGRYGQRLAVRAKDELGFLVESFNTMTEKLAQASEEARLSRLEVERQRTYLETVLSNLSSGVLSFDNASRLLTANRAVDDILHVPAHYYLGLPVSQLKAEHPYLAEPLDRIERWLEKGAGTWQDEISFLGPMGRRELYCHGTPLFNGSGEKLGAVVVFDDITALIFAQRQAAWSEVARRLAHEIKNPLTPIQLSAERLHHKLASRLDARDAEVLDRSTRTIVHQVEALKAMVNAFAEYARSSTIQLRRVALAEIVEEVVALYPPQSGIAFEIDEEPNLPRISADPLQLRQVLHNLIKNSQEALAPSTQGNMCFVLSKTVDQGETFVQLTVRDNGPGIPKDQVDRIFEPYVTTKTKGTGLGLAIVKKIIEEHGGTIRVENGHQQGAGFIIRFPIPETDMRAEANGGSSGARS